MKQKYSKSQLLKVALQFDANFTPVSHSAQEYRSSNGFSSHRDSAGEGGALADLIQRPPEELPSGFLAVLRPAVGRLADGMPLRALGHPPEHVLQLDRRLHLEESEQNLKLSIPFELEI